MKRATGLGGVFFRAKDPRGTAEWYAKHLGLEVQLVERGAQMSLFTWKELGRGGREAYTVWAAFPSDTPYFGSKRQPLMLNYRVDDLQGLLEELRKEGVRVVKRMQVSPYGKFGWVEDPEGHRVELWEPRKPRARRKAKPRRRARRG